MTKIREVHYPDSDWPVVRFVKRKRQKYIRIRVADEHITVSAPWYSSHREMELFLMEKRRWVNSTLSKIILKKSNIRALREQNGNKILLRGEWKPLVRDTGLGNGKWRFEEQNDRILFTAPAGRSGFPDKDTLNRFYRRIAGMEIRRRLEERAAVLPFSYKKVFIRSQKTKWGTCSTRGNLSFNWRLIKCPLFVLDYLIVHELCHTVYMNHSRDFWNLVQHHCPDYKRAKKWIDEHGSLVFSDP